MKLPNTDKAVIAPEKLLNYLLSSSHPIGRFKAEFFQSMGFTREAWELLEVQIRAQLINDATAKETTEYGQKYEIRGTVLGPTGRTRDIVTAWIVLKGEEIPRFITAYPGA